MRISFRRMADRRPVETLVERNDGVVFSMRGAGGGSDLPHDLVHAVVEAHLGLGDGIWGCVADGVVWRSMTHLSGRQPPHAAERSDRLKRERAASVQRAETLADLVSRVASGAEVLPGEIPATGLPPERLAAAAAGLLGVQRQWAALGVEETWVVEWGALRTTSPTRPDESARRSVHRSNTRRSGHRPG